MEITDEQIAEAEQLFRHYDGPVFGFTYDACQYGLRLATALTEAREERDLYVRLKIGQTERADELHKRGVELVNENEELRARIAELEAALDARVDAFRDAQGQY